MIEPKVPALDYERVKDFFYEKLDADRHGHGRMESAFFHTAQWVFLQGCLERDRLLERIAELEKEVDNLPADAHCAALSMLNAYEGAESCRSSIANTIHHGGIQK